MKLNLTLGFKDLARLAFSSVPWLAVGILVSYARHHGSTSHNAIAYLSIGTTFIGRDNVQTLSLSDACSADQDRPFWIFQRRKIDLNGGVSGPIACFGLVLPDLFPGRRCESASTLFQPCTNAEKRPNGSECRARKYLRNLRHSATVSLLIRLLDSP